jgi:hypothetical protein
MPYFSWRVLLESPFSPEWPIVRNHQVAEAQRATRVYLKKKKKGEEEQILTQSSCALSPFRKTPAFYEQKNVASVSSFFLNRVIIWAARNPRIKAGPASLLPGNSARKAGKRSCKALWSYKPRAPAPPHVFDKTIILVIKENRGRWFRIESLAVFLAMIEHEQLRHVDR